MNATGIKSKDEIDKFFALVDKTSRKFLRRIENYVDRDQG
jgi:hypothetical protein